MQWNHIDIDNLASKTKTANANIIIGFNEPELPDQSNMTPELAAKEWLRCIEPLRKRGIRAGSPGISSAPQGVVWLNAFLRLIHAQGSDVDFYCLHWYGEGLGGFYDYIWSTFHQLPSQNKKVWITEFAATNWNAERPLGREVVGEFLKASVKYLDELEWVEGYAWFGAMTQRDMGAVGRWAGLMEDGGGLTDLGRVYRDM